MLDQTGHHDRAILMGYPLKCLGRRSAGYRLSHFREISAAQVLKKRVAGDRALVEADDLSSKIDCFLGQVIDPNKVIRLVVIAMLELRCGDADVSHRDASHDGPEGCKLPLRDRATPPPGDFTESRLGSTRLARWIAAAFHATMSKAKRWSGSKISTSERQGPIVVVASLIFMEC
jgi:hypothetical protein